MGVALALSVLAIGALVVPAIAGADETAPTDGTVLDTTTTTAGGDASTPPAGDPATPPAGDPATPPDPTSPPTVDAPTAPDASQGTAAPSVGLTAADAPQPADVGPAAAPARSDTRTTFVGDNPNVGNECANVPLEGTTYTTGNAPANGSTNVGGLFTVTIASYTAGDVQAPFQIENGGTIGAGAQMLQLSNIGANVTINGVMVKGGPAYQVYSFGTNAGYVGVNMIAPLNSGGNVPQISHALVCYTATEVTTGSITVTKTPVGPVPDGTTFTVTVSCPSTGTQLAGFPKIVTFNNLGVLTSANLPITGIPTGTVCKVEETSTGGADSVSYTVNGGSSSSTPPTVIIGNGTTQTVAVTNTFNEESTGSLAVTKTVVGPVPNGTTFTVTVSCPSTGSQLSGFPKTLIFDSSGVLTSGVSPITGIPVGTQCKVEETGTGGADTVTYTLDANAPTTTPPTPQITTTLQTVKVTNTFTEVGGDFSGQVHIEKKITGVPPAQGTQFVVHVHCTGPTVAVDEDVTLTYSTVLTGSVSFQAPTDETVTCTVTEKDPLGGAVSATIGPNNGIVVLTVDASSADVTVTNHYGDPKVEVGGISATNTLPFTGSSTDILLKSAAWLLAVGGLLWFFTRARRRRGSLT